MLGILSGETTEFTAFWQLEPFQRQYQICYPNYMSYVKWYTLKKYDKEIRKHKHLLQKRR
jgi:hypothetical protein